MILQKELGHRTLVLPSLSYMTFMFMPQGHCPSNDGEHKVALPLRNPRQATDDTAYILLS